MATIALCRGALRRNAIPLTLTMSTGAVLASRQRPMRMDGLSGTPTSSASPTIERAEVKSNEWLSPAVIKQLSQGSLAGFLAGVLVSVFSKTLVLVTGIAIVAIQLASRNGVDLLGMLKLRERVQSSRVLSALEKNPTFKVAFGTTFALAAFMQF
ncbi:hypothetical protein BD289DRAFT_451209 [Coniella lustricola]|uniref:FUN14 family-domain-containing protein n=1 Tax=Coniella lustricola TaxID=2025994 RepID=A0A2T3AFK0_9PEZI|nr:hypothetical protein BD289DRAFT_451209 [Coniella lustricola]